MPLPDKIIFIGMPGSGKTTLGSQFAEDVSLPFFDLDTIIETNEQKTIHEIFESDGEDHFRKVESEALKSFLSGHKRYLLSSGGGTPCFFDNMDLMLRSATTVFVDVPEDILIKRLYSTNLKERPLLNEQDLSLKIKNTLKSRRVFYERAHYTISGAEVSAASIKKLLEEEA